METANIRAPQPRATAAGAFHAHVSSRIETGSLAPFQVRTESSWLRSRNMAPRAASINHQRIVLKGDILVRSGLLQQNHHPPASGAARLVSHATPASDHDAGVAKSTLDRKTPLLFESLSFWSAVRVLVKPSHIGTCPEFFNQKRLLLSALVWSWPNLARRHVTRVFAI
jgi:hypothetical protein